MPMPFVLSFLLQTVRAVKALQDADCFPQALVVLYAAIDNLAWLAAEEDEISYAKGGTSRKAYRVHVPAHVDVRAIRRKLGMTQQAFAARFGFSINTLRHWEQGKREPEGPTRAYLHVIDRAPRAVERALRIA